MDNNLVIFPVHPAFSHREWTVQDCYDIGFVTGVNPQFITNILMGKMIPDEFTSKYLYSEMGEESLRGAIEDFNPTRFMDIRDDPFSGEKKYSIKQWYSITQVKKGDLISVHDGRWMEVSGVVRRRKSVLLYSGEAFVSSLSAKTHLVVAVLVRGGSGRAASKVREEFEIERANSLIDDEGKKQQREDRLNQALG